MVTITVLVDNFEWKEGLKYGWGFSALIETPTDTVLFDTGPDPSVLRFNAEALGVDLASVKAVVISHEHWDHAGGLAAVLEANPGVRVIRPGSPEPVQVAEGIMTTGTLPGEPLPEQGLVVETPEGPVLLVGCSHPGVVNLARRATELVGPLRMVIGGTHLLHSSKEEVKRVSDELRALGVKQIALSHCTGEEQAGWLEEWWGENYIRSGRGKVFRFGQ